ncbi:MAG: RIO1 family regulatory kinase/ATPase [Nanoarchaeota archaeon]
MARMSKEIWKVDKNVFSLAAERALYKLSGQGYFDELVSPVSIGKEANIFSASTHDGGRIIVKIYRVENCNFNTMYQYIRPDPRYMTIKKQRRQIIFTWVQREYRNMLNAREVIRVPTPLAVRENVLLMEFIGKEAPAPKLKDTRIRDPALFNKIIKGVRALYKAGFVHADLSEYNILMDGEQPVFIDLSQMTTIENPNHEEYMLRDLGIICKYFRSDKKPQDILDSFKKK